ncbi:choloylglycine hydrolase family protein [Legionella septentrionalis]|uniref:Choloylglycine hydrolase family protein n=1 Tax=Legionella septentrionalis TaxID=2498109 RepID=A0A433JJ08_9GAMM|nr:choloylglycine hydrolase family protein [Legionella septentrionalis]RUQ85405.1 choloylglycine hydrolase family protein [Legionella septentrionalis]
MSGMKRVLYCLGACFMLGASHVLACTGLQLKAQDGAFINGRTVEFGIPMNLSGLVISRNYEFIGTLPEQASGLRYRAKYAAIGGSAFDEASILDGINEKGLSAGMFYFPGYASYTAVTPENQSRALAPTEFITWVLTQFATVDEVKQGINTIVIAPTAQKNWGGVPPFHYIVYDKTGKSIVIEPLNGRLTVWDNPIGVITNSPTFDWHLTNLSNYMNLSPFNIPSKNIGGLQLKEFGQGNGLRGLPGDFTPPSRFVRAALYSASALPIATAEQGVFNVFHILNQFDIPVGAVRAEENGKMMVENTLATTVKDPQNLKYYFKTYEDQSIRVIDLQQFDLNSKELISISFSGKQAVTDVSKKGMPLQKSKKISN